MNHKRGSSIQLKKASSFSSNKGTLPGSRLPSSNSVAANPNRVHSARERKFALIQEVDKLTRKLKQEQDIHKALERALKRPIGALPRLPPYLAPCMSELLAEVAVLEEEVVQLEKLVVKFRQGLYKEAACTSSSRKGSSVLSSSSDVLPKGSKGMHSRSVSQSEMNLESSRTASSRDLMNLESSRTASSRDLLSSGKECSNNKLPSKEQSLIKIRSPQRDRLGKENRFLPNLVKYRSSLTKKALAAANLSQKSPMNPQSIS